MKTHLRSVVLALAVAVLSPPAGSRLLAQVPNNRVLLENVNRTRGNKDLGDIGATSVAFSPDGQTVAAGSMCVIKFWNVATGEKTAHLTAHAHWVNCIAFAPDGKNLASASYLGDNAPLVKLWDLSQSGQAQAPGPGITGKWLGTDVNDTGQSDAFLDVTENEDGTLTGTWGAPNYILKIGKGERITADVLRWESSTATHRWVVRAKVSGRSMVLETTSASKENGKVKGGTGTSALTRVAPIAQEVLPAELGKLQGTWTIFSHEVEGAQAPFNPRATFTFTGNTWIFKAGEHSESGIIKFVTAPHAFDLLRTGETYKGLTTHALFHVDGTTMKYCARGRDDQALPRRASFTTKPGDHTFLDVYKRPTSGLPKPAPRAQGQERHTRPEVPADLLKAQVASARRVYEASLKMYQAGAPKSGAPESFYRWSVRWLNAERDLSKKPADQVAAVEAHLKRMKTVEAMAQQLAKIEAAGVRHAAAAEFYRVEAEIWLARAKAK